MIKRNEKEQEFSRDFAGMLLDIGAVKLSLDPLFTWTSGIQSPIYCDNRKILSHPGVRNFVRDFLVQKIHETNLLTNRRLNDKKVFIAGVATGAIGMAAIVADHLHIPCVYVRPEPKGHGLKNQVEGDIEILQKSEHVIFIEDLISTGKSSLLAVNAVRELDCNVENLLAGFTYGFDEADKAFESSNIGLYTITDFEILCEVAVSNGYIAKPDVNLLKSFAADPKNWKVA